MQVHLHRSGINFGDGQKTVQQVLHGTHRGVQAGHQVPGLHIMRQLPQARHKHAQCMGGLAQVVAGSGQKLRLGAGGGLGLVFLLPQGCGGGVYAAGHVVMPELKLRRHLVQAPLQFTQRVIGQHFVADRKFTLANAPDHARHPHDRPQHPAPDKHRECPAKQQPAKRDGDPGGQHVTFAAVE